MSWKAHKGQNLSVSDKVQDPLRRSYTTPWWPKSQDHAWYWRHWQRILKLQARTLIPRKARTKGIVTIPGTTRKVPELISLTRSMSSKNGQADVCIIPRTEGNTQANQGDVCIIPRTEGNTQASQGNVCIIPRTEGNTQANQGSWDLWRGAWTKEETCLSPQHSR